MREHMTDLRFRRLDRGLYEARVGPEPLDRYLVAEGDGNLGPRGGQDDSWYLTLPGDHLSSSRTFYKRGAVLAARRHYGEFAPTRSGKGTDMTDQKKVVVRRCKFCEERFATMDLFHEACERCTEEYRQGYGEAADGLDVPDVHPRFSEAYDEGRSDGGQT